MIVTTLRCIFWSLTLLLMLFSQEISFIRRRAKRREREAEGDQKKKKKKNSNQNKERLFDIILYDPINIYSHAMKVCLLSLWMALNFGQSVVQVGNVWQIYCLGKYGICTASQIMERRIFLIRKVLFKLQIGVGSLFTIQCRRRVFTYQLYFN